MPPRIDLFEDDLIFSAFLLKRVQVPNGELTLTFAQVRKYINHVKEFMKENGIEFDYHYGAGQPLPNTVSDDYARLINSMRYKIDNQNKTVSVGKEYDEKLLNIKLSCVIPFHVLPFTKPDGYEDDLGLEPTPITINQNERGR